MLDAFIGYNSNYYENAKKDTENPLYAYIGSDPPGAVNTYYVCSSEAGT